MGSPLGICRRRGVVAVLASGVVISLTALTGGVAPAFAKPDDEQPVVPTTPFVLPEPEYSMPEPEEVAPAPKKEAPAPERPVAPQPTRAVEVPEAPAVEAPPAQTQAPEVVEPQPPTQEPQAPATPTRPPVTTAEPAAPSEPVEEPEPVEPPAPRSEEPAPAAEAPAPKSQAPAPTSEPAPKRDDPEPTTASSEPTLVSPTDALAPDSEEAPTSDAAATPDAERSAAPTTESETATREATEAAEETDSSSTEPATSEVSQAARVIETAQPQTLEAEKQDVEQAKAAKPVEEKVPAPAAEKDVASFTNAINLSLGRDGVNAGANTEFRLGGDRDRDWDWARKVRQWRPDWVEYDQFYRPIIMNPFRAPVRIVYLYDFAPRIVYIPPLARIVLDVARYAAYSFTAAILNPINAAIDLAQDAVYAAANVAVGSFFGGGYVPRVGLPLPAPPPPVLRYDNVPVLVRYSQQSYEPFRVRRIVDVGDDRQYGERKVLLDGVTPAWGQWTQTASGERQFEVHKTQQFPGLDTPQEGPLPGDYPLRLASDESSTAGMTGRDVFLYVAAGVVGTLGFGAIAMAFYLGRRRPEH